MDTPATIIDLLDNFLDGDLTEAAVKKLTASDMANLYDAVNDFYDSWEIPPVKDGFLRAHLGGWVARTGATGIGRDVLNSALLYAHEVVIYDPIGAYFERRRGALRRMPAIRGAHMTANSAAVNIESTDGYANHRHELKSLRQSVALGINELALLAPLIRAGVAVPIPHIRLTLDHQEAIFTAVRRLLDDKGWREAVDNQIDRPALTQDEKVPFRVHVHPRTKHDQRLQHWGDPAYYLARTLAMTAAAGASYVPPSATEWNIYEHRLRVAGEELRKSQRRELTVAPAIVASGLPFFDNLPAASLIAARESADAFESWRRHLRAATRQITASPNDGEEFVVEARGILEDELIDVAEEVRKETSLSGTLKKHLRPTAISMSTGVTGTAAAASALGSPLLPGVVGMTVGGLAKWIIDSAFPQHLPGHKAVLANFVHRKPREQTADDWPTREVLILTPKRQGGHAPGLNPLGLRPRS